MIRWMSSSKNPPSGLLTAEVRAAIVASVARKRLLAGLWSSSPN